MAGNSDPRRNGLEDWDPAWLSVVVRRSSGRQISLIEPKAEGAEKKQAMAKEYRETGRLGDWEMARNWLQHERVTGMSAKVRRRFCRILISMVLLSPLIP